MSAEDSGFASAELTPGAFDERLAAFLVDLLVVRVGMTALMVGFGAATGFRFPASSVAAVFTALLFPAFIAYHAFFSRCGGAPGKRFMGLRVVSMEDGLGLGQAVLRPAAYLLSSLPLFLGFFWVFVNDEGRAWHDLLAKTAVVRSGEGRRRGRLFTFLLTAAILAAAVLARALREVA